MTLKRRKKWRIIYFIIPFIFIVWIGMSIISIENNNEESISAIAPTPEFEVIHEVKGNKLYLEFRLNHFALKKEKLGKKSTYGEGHIILFIDGQEVAKIFKSAYVHSGLTPGRHMVRLELVHNNQMTYGILQNFPIFVRSADELFRKDEYIDEE